MKSRRRRDADRAQAELMLTLSWLSCELFVELDQHCHNHKGFRQTMDSK
jgi:hypothetical protein